MGWSVLGNDFRFSFEVNKDGLSVSGEGCPIYRSSLNVHIDTSEIDFSFRPLVYLSGL
jgi:hypothetical protein